jgi:pimeloyl-ACP methyl ester carboxylesterase
MPAAGEKETVVLLHGILRRKVDMTLIAHRLESEGYHVINLGYPSREKSIEELRDHIHAQLSAMDEFNNASKVHFVTHSMGGLVARHLIHAHRPANLGRVVMLSPPNQGSELADFMLDHPRLQSVYKKLYGPAGKQLTTNFNHGIPDSVDYPLGIIAGTGATNPLTKRILGPNDNDGTVSVERMKIDGMADIIEIPAMHSFMMFKVKIIDQTVHFLKHAKFNHS